MAKYKIKTNQSFKVEGVPLVKGLSVEVVTLSNTPYDEMGKINQAFQSEHGVDFDSAGLLTPGHFQYELI